MKVAMYSGGLIWSLAEGYLLKLSFSITHVTYGCAAGYARGEEC